MMKRLKYHAVTAYLVAVFGTFWLIDRARKAVRGDRSPSTIFPFGGTGARRF